STSRAVQHRPELIGWPINKKHDPLARDRDVLITSSSLSTTACARCEDLDRALKLERGRNAELEAERATLRVRLAEALKLVQVQRADLERFKKAYEAARPNHPERVAREQLQLAFERILLALAGPANDASTDDGKETTTAETTMAETNAPPAERPPPRKGHG